MPEILPDHVPSPRTLLAWDGTAFRPVTIDAAGHLQLDVLSNANLDNALQSVATDRLIVRGEDQLFSYEDPLAETATGNPSSDDGWLASPVVPANRIWKITHVCGQNSTRVLTGMRFYSRIGGVARPFVAEQRAIALAEVVCTPCEVYLETNDTIRVYFIGSLAADTVALWVHGHEMTLET